VNAPEGGFPPRSAPIRVEGGIRARTRRGAIGRSWWSQRFIEALESFDLQGRLARGRSYARRGQVLALEIAAGEVTATVQGSRPEPYRVRIVLPPLPEAAWAAVERALSEQAIYTARLLAGQMPTDIEEAFAACGAPLFPRRRAELRMSCSCPDPAVPCKHLAAAFYLLAEAFDDDPFRILHWRGRPREALLARLRELRGGPAAAIAEPAAAEIPVVGAARALAQVTSPPLAEVADRFWVPPVPLPDRPPILPTEPDLLLRQLPTPPAALGGRELTARLRAAYQRFRHRDPADT
jgi:uncharacterized Zn finger protein